MTAQTFYRNLKKCADKFVWNIGPYGAIRAVSKSNPGDQFCVITAVTNAKTDKVILFYRFKEASRELGLLDNEAERIAYSSDALKYKRSTNAVRKAIMRAVGLSTNKP